MENVIKLVQSSLNEKRVLSNSELLLIIESLLKKYRMLESIKDINLGYKSISGDYAGYDSKNGICFFDFYSIQSAVFYKCETDQYDVENEKRFSFFELLILEQLRTILHEIRHIIQIHDNFNGREILKTIIDDSNISNYSSEVYRLNYSLFPTEKDARIFSFDQTIEIIKKCQVFCDDILRIMYKKYFYTLCEGYNLKEPYNGSLSEFYELVVGNYSKYLEIISKTGNLVTHDKMSFNLPLNQDDVKNILAVPDLIYRGHNPTVILKKEIKRR